jgi:2'-5' RNA ligase
MGAALPNMARTRTFIAVEITSALRRRAVELARQLAAASGDVKWVAAENLHWTMQFLGDVDELEIPAVCAAVAAAAAERQPFDLAAIGVGAFPSADRPRTLWLGAGQGAEAMIGLHSAIERRLRKLGYRGENRRFTPHLTIGRAGRTSRPQSLAQELAALADFDAGMMRVDQVTVFASQLTRDGPIYDALSRLPLAP